MTTSGLYQIASTSTVNVETRLDQIKTLIGALTDAAGTGAATGLLPRLLALINSLDGLEGSLGDATASPTANTLQARLKAAVDTLTTINTAVSAQKSPVSGATTQVVAVPGGVQIAAAAAGGVLYRRVTIQVVSGTPLNLYNAGVVSGTPRIQDIPVGVVYIVDFLGQIFGSSSTSATVNVTIDTY